VSEPFHELGREANNELAGEFEDQIVAMCKALGWPVICRNIDAFVKHQGQSQSRGFDVLAQVRDPQYGRREGIVLEAKRHEEPAYAEASSEAQTLHDKIGRLNATPAFWENASISTQIDPPLRHGAVCHRTLGFDTDKAEVRRQDAQLRNRKLGAPVPVVQFLGPDLLEALAHLSREYQPVRWLWTPTRRRDSVWHDACSPFVLIGGFAAFEGPDGVQRVWLHDTLAHGDCDLLGQVFSDWGINPAELICTRLRPETWRLVKDDWARAVEQTAQRAAGRLPQDVQARVLSGNLTTFDQTWANAA
jgi:hypothetical protein